MAKARPVQRSVIEVQLFVFGFCFVLANMHAFAHNRPVDNADKNLHAKNPPERS
jgi:hypothetical protein